jgi:hypothetical protein
VEEDGAGFLAYGGLVGRHTMSKEGHWPKVNTTLELEHKLVYVFGGLQFFPKVLTLT